jgi:sucrose-6-phosphate hydrolase SacC (GH32 family)
VRFQGTYLNLYSGYDGRTWHTGAASSPDGIAWRKLGRVLSPSGWEGNYIAANGSALVENGEILYWYVAGNPWQIGMARSRDGIAWTKHPSPVLPPGPRGSFDELAAADPDVIRRGEFLYMFYTGLDRARRQRVGVARSRDGIAWEKLRSNPLLELGPPGAFDEHAVGEPAVWTSGGSYWMLYTGSDREEHRKLGLAQSLNGVEWQRVPSFTPVGGAQNWDRQVLCDPSLDLEADGAVRVWFGGGDVPSPDQNLHGQIGVGILRGSGGR